MNAPYHLSRATLRRQAGFEAIARLLAPTQANEATRSGHHLVWSLFADDPSAKRDFLWHQEKPGTYLVLSARRPLEHHALFDIETKAFSPSLVPGAQLAFMLRANPTVTIRGNDGARRHADVVMHAITLERRQGSGRTTRDAREEALQPSGAAGQWLVRQGEKAGFLVDPDNLFVDGYRRIAIPRTRKSDSGNERYTVTFHSIEYQGLLTVQEPALFLDRVCHGFGRAKSYGCGLMLLRRAQALGGMGG